MTSSWMLMGVFKLSRVLQNCKKSECFCVSWIPIWSHSPWQEGKSFIILCKYPSVETNYKWFSRWNCCEDFQFRANSCNLLQIPKAKGGWAVLQQWKERISQEKAMINMSSRQINIPTPRQRIFFEREGEGVLFWVIGILQNSGLNCTLAMQSCFRHCFFQISQTFLPWKFTSS